MLVSEVSYMMLGCYFWINIILGAAASGSPSFLVLLLQDQHQSWHCCFRVTISLGTAASGSPSVLVLLLQDHHQCWYCCFRITISVGTAASGSPSVLVLALVLITCVDGRDRLRKCLNDPNPKVNLAIEDYFSSLPNFCIFSKVLCLLLPI